MTKKQRQAYNGLSLSFCITLFVALIKSIMTVLSENGFMTNEKECHWLMTEETIESIAMTHVEGIVQYLFKK